MQITLGVRGTGASDNASGELPRTSSGVRPWTPEELLHGKQFVLSKQCVQPQLVDGKSVSLPSPVRRPTTLGALVKSSKHAMACRPSFLLLGLDTPLCAPRLLADSRLLLAQTFHRTTFLQRHTTFSQMRTASSQSATALAPLVHLTPVETLVSSIPEFVPTKIADYRPAALKKSYGERTICARVPTSEHIVVAYIALHLFCCQIGFCSNVKSDSTSTFRQAQATTGTGQVCRIPP
jgi:hypothetical protein